jgi:hypothetical protein
MTHRASDLAEGGPRYHHGPEVFPVIELIIGGGLPMAAALWLGGWRSVRARLSGGSTRAPNGDRGGG